MAKVKFVPLILIIVLLFTGSLSNAKESKYRVVLDYNYNSLRYINNNYVVEKNKKWGILSVDGKTILNFQTFPIDYFSEGLIPIQQSSGVGFMDTTGKKVIGPKWDYVSLFSEGLAGVALKRNSAS